MHVLNGIDAAVLKGAPLESVEAIRRTLEDPAVIVAPGWLPLASGLGLVESSASADDGEILIVGSANDLIVLAGTAHPGRGELGFVTVGNWYRTDGNNGGPDHWDPTLRLWQKGWSVVRVDRPTVTTRETTVEFAIGIARPTPVVTPTADPA